jgi:hypothetical protein
MDCFIDNNKDVFEYGILPFLCLSDGITFSMVNKDLRKVIFHENRLLFVMWVLQPMLRIILPCHLQTNWVDNLSNMPILPAPSCVVSTVSSQYMDQFQQLESVNMLSREAYLILLNFNKMQYKNEMYRRYIAKPQITLERVLLELRHVHFNNIDYRSMFARDVYSFFESSIYCTLQEAKKQLEKAYLFALGLVGCSIRKSLDSSFEALLPPFVKKFVTNRDRNDPRLSLKSVKMFQQIESHQKPWLFKDTTRDTKLGILNVHIKKNNMLWKCEKHVKKFVRNYLIEPEKTVTNYTILFNFFATLHVSASHFDNEHVEKRRKSWKQRFPATVYVTETTFKFQETDIKIPESVIYFENSTQRVVISHLCGTSARAFIDKEGVLHTTLRYSPSMMSKQLGFHTLLNMFNSFNEVDKVASRLGIVTGNCIYCARKMKDIKSQKRGYGLYCGNRMGMKDEINIFIASENRKRKREI